MAMGAGKQDGSNFGLFHIGDDDLSFTEEDFFLPSIPSSTSHIPAHVNNNNGSKHGASIPNTTANHGTGPHAPTKEGHKAKNFQFSNRQPLQSSTLNNQTVPQQHGRFKGESSRLDSGGSASVKDDQFQKQTRRPSSTSLECEPARKLPKFDQQPIDQSKGVNSGDVGPTPHQPARTESPHQFKFRPITPKSACGDHGAKSSNSRQTSSQFNNNPVQFRDARIHQNSISKPNPVTAQSERHQVQQPHKAITKTTPNTLHARNGPQRPGVPNEQSGNRSVARTVSSQFSNSPQSHSQAVSGQFHANTERRNTLQNSTPHQRNRLVQEKRQQFTPVNISSPTPGIRPPGFQGAGRGQFIRQPHSTNRQQLPRQNISPHQAGAIRLPVASAGISPAGIPNQQITRPKAATPQAPLLTSRIAQLCQTPVTSGSSTTKAKTRKFPGPAGLLPRLTSGQKITEADLHVPSSKGEEKSSKSLNDSMVVTGSQDTEDEFSRGAWMNMKKDMDLNENDPDSILSQSNIAIVMRKASLKQLAKGKVPHLCVLIKSVNFCDASAVFRDPSGEMQGTVHRKLLEEYQSDMKPGTALVLRQVSVLSPSLRNHYLNITPANLIQVYSAVDCNTSLSASQTLPSRVQEVSGNPVSGDEEKTAECVTDPHNDGQFGSVARKGTENQGNTKHSPDRPSTFHGSVDGVKGKTAMAGRPRSLNHQEFKHKNTNNNNACDTNSASTESTAMSGCLGNTACENPTGAFDTENLDALLEGIEEDELFADF